MFVQVTISSIILIKGISVVPIYHAVGAQGTLLMK